MKKKGFTLMELIIVIAVMGVLIAIITPAWLNYIAKSRIETQNSNSRVIFNSAQTVVQDYKFTEKNTDDADKCVYPTNYYLEWDGGSASAYYFDSEGDRVDLSDDKAEKVAAKVNRLFSGDDTTCYKVWVENYLVKSVVSGRTDTDQFIGSYPVKQEERQPSGNSVSGYDMTSVQLGADADPST